MRHDSLNGLGDFGGELGQMWGALIASGVGTGVAIGTRFMTTAGSTASKWSEGFGLLAGLLAGGVMMAFPGTHEAGKIGMAVTGVNQGLRLLETLLRGGSVGWAMTESSNPALGMPSAQQLAYAMATNQPHAYGTVPGVAGPTAGPMRDTGSPPVQLLAPNNSFGMSSLYGATHFHQR